MTTEEVTRRIGAVHFEAVLRTAIGLGQAGVMEHRPDIEQFRIEFQTPALPGKGAKKVDAVE